MNASLTSQGMEFEEEQAGVVCSYGTPIETTLGPVTGGSPTTLTVSAELTKISGGALCANPAHWEAHYVVTSPSPLFVAES